MSLEKLHNYVRGVMQRNVVQIDEHDKKKMLELLPYSQEMKSTLAGNQCKIVRRTLDHMHIWPQPAQEIELFVMAHRLKKAIEIDDWPTCNKCGVSVQETVSIAVGTDLYSCCRACADKISDFITEEQ